MSLFDKINNTNLCKLIGLEVKAFEQKKTIFNSPLIKLEGSVALGYKRGNGFSTIKINPNGTLEGIGITATLSAIESLIGPEKTVALTASIAELSVRTGTVELAYSVSSNAEGFKCELQIPVKVFLDNEHNNSITGTISLTFTIKKDGSKDALDATMSEIKSFSGQYSILIGLLLIAITVIILLSGGVTAAATAGVLILFTTILSLPPSNL
ncbi:hypothetical protein LAV44_18460 [Clostridium sporogenes]|uniref:hypothetical protein n=1 Tax=Clostridium sporogenes TaxID=1509 RepID=UPI0022384CE0|nr:hypothetical protein [Clostridium sporogenes]MCW6077270.1 hypothetical protein [Clostridium sporogenes]